MRENTEDSTNPLVRIRTEAQNSLRCVYASTRPPRRSTTDTGTYSTSCCVNSRRHNRTALRATSSSPGQVRLTLEDLAERRSLVGVQVRVGVRVGDASSAGVIVV